MPLQCFAGQKLASTNTNFLMQSRDLHRHTWATSPTIWDHFDSQFHTFNRAAGAVQVISAGIELGQALVALPACVTLVGCAIPLAAGQHALDDAQAGIRSLVSGDAVETYAFEAIKAATGREAAARASEIGIGLGAGGLDDLMKLARTSVKSTSAGAARHVARRVAFESGTTVAGGVAGGVITAGPGEGFNWDGALMGASLGQVSGAVAGHYSVACFTAGTPIVVDLEGNSSPIEELEVGDVVLARNEFDPTGPLELKRIEEKFVRTAAVMELTIRGRSIKTTAEHPFYVPTQGKFVPAGELKAGDELVSHVCELVAIDSVSPLREIAAVYNLRVADHHTYFVGESMWGWNVWVHNAYNAPVRGLTTLDPSDIRFSQTTVKRQGATVNDLAESMRRNGFIAEPEPGKFLDVVRMPDGRLTTLDNTRILAARRAGVNVEARVFNFDEASPSDPDFVRRFLGRKGDVPKTFGEAVLNRIGGQNRAFREAHPFGSQITGSAS